MSEIIQPMLFEALGIGVERNLEGFEYNTTKEWRSDTRMGLIVVLEKRAARDHGKERQSSLQAAWIARDASA